jgi:hypothetical protein
MFWMDLERNKGQDDGMTKISAEWAQPMQTLNHYVSHTLLNFEEFQELLRSNQPIGMERYKAKCSMLAISFHHALESLINEKESEICELLNITVTKSSNGRSPKNQIVTKLFSCSFDYMGMKISGEVLRVFYDVGDVAKHKKIAPKYRKVSRYSQIEECLILLLNNSSSVEYYSIHPGIMVTTEEGKEINLEKVANLSTALLSSLLYKLGIIDGLPDVWGQCRNFDLSREEAEGTFLREKSICELPQFGERGSPKMLAQVFDHRTPQSIRFPKDSDCFNFDVTIPVEVVSTPFITKPRKSY